MDNEKANTIAAGGPGVIRLGEQTYLVGQPDDRDFAAILAYVEEHAISPMQGVAEDLKYLPPHLHAVAIKAAVEVKAAGGVEMSEAFTQKHLMQPAGTTFLAWLLIRKEQPAVTREELAPLITTDNAIMVLGKLIQASGLEAILAGKLGPAGSPGGAGPTGSPHTAASLTPPTAA